MQYEIDSVFETAAEAYAREAALILAFKRLQEGGPLTNLAPGGGTDAGISPISKEKHRVSLGGIPDDDPELATINQYLLSIGDPRSICVKVAKRFKARPTQPYPDKKIGQSPRQAYALTASAAANSIMLEPGCFIPRLFSVDGVEGIVENGVCCDFVTSGMAELVPHADPRLERFTLNSKQISIVEEFVGSEKLRDLGLVA
ncbi:MAG: GIY-YIG nuclease family protein [Terriglobia bacterium]|nr:GIY-YIG nuclease family protein [Terriglobia bacterium]